MSKPVIGILLGAILGAFDGLTAWFTPAVRAQIGGIVIGSTIKGIIAGLAIGFFARNITRCHRHPIRSYCRGTTRISDGVAAGWLLF